MENVKSMQGVKLIATIALIVLPCLAFYALMTNKSIPFVVTSVAIAIAKWFEVFAKHEIIRLKNQSNQ